MPSHSPLSARETVELIHGYAWNLARQSNTRVLFIKGLTAEAIGVRPRRDPADVDILLDPKDYVGFVNNLVADGWLQRPSFKAKSVVPEHSITLYHPQWSCDIDLHFFFPGMETDPSTAFEALWEDHQYLELAHQRIPYPSVAGSVIVMALHSLRNIVAEQDRAEKELGHLIQVVKTENPQGVLELTRKVGALGTMAPFLADVYGPQILADVPDTSESWQIRTQSHYGAAVWFMEVGKAPWNKKASTLFRAVWPSTEQLKARNLHLSEAPASIRKARLERFKRGVAGIPTFISDGLAWGSRKTSPAERLVTPSPENAPTVAEIQQTSEREYSSENAESTVDSTQHKQYQPTSAGGHSREVPVADAENDLKHRVLAVDQGAAYIVTDSTPFAARIVAVGYDQQDSPTDSAGHIVPIVLTETAAELWLLIDGSRTYDEIVQELANKYYVPSSQVYTGCAPYVHNLHSSGLITWQSELS